MILEIRATDTEARKQAGYATKVAEANKRDFMYRAGTFEKEVNARLDSFGMGLQYRGKQIKDLDEKIASTSHFLSEQLAKALKPPSVVHQNVQVQTDFAAQFSMQLNNNDKELATVTGAQRQLAHRLHLVEGQQNALALGLPTIKGATLETNLTAAQHDIRQLRLDYNKLDRQFIEMRAAIGEALLTKTPTVKDSETTRYKIDALESRLDAQTAIIQRQEERHSDQELRLEAFYVLLKTKANTRRKTPK